MEEKIKAILRHQYPDKYEDLHEQSAELICALSDVRLSLPTSDEITDAAMEYADIRGDDPFDVSVRDAAHFVAGATWYHNRIKSNGN